MAVSRHRHWRLAGLAVGVALAAVATTLLALNLLIGNKQIDRPLEPMFAVDAPTFERTMSLIL